METIIRNQGYLYTFSKDNFKRGRSTPSETKNSQKKEVIPILIADDHPYLIHGVRTDLDKDPGIKIAGTASSYDELLEKASELQPDIVLLDLRMPGRDKHDLKHYMAGLKAVGNCKVIIFSNETGWARIHKCLEIGAQAYIEKAISIGRLNELIHRVYENEEILIYTAEELPKVEFSKRQKEVLHYIADGKENDEIGLLLNIDVKTVQSYINEIKSKLANAFNIHPIKPRTLMLLASKLGFGARVR